MVMQQKWMKLHQEWDDSGLEDFLLYDYWSPHIGLCTLSGFDYRACPPNNSPDEFNETYALSPGSLQGHHGQDAEEAREILINMNQDILRLRNIWANSKWGMEAEDHVPAFFIEWALSKNIRPDWLDWAIARKLYIPNKKADLVSQPKTQSSDNLVNQGMKWRKAFEYESEGLNALYDLIERRFFDAEGKPIYDSGKWPLKKALESDWLTGRTLDEADTIITSSKRKGKAKK
jgi:hypothetical protein